MLLWMLLALMTGGAVLAVLWPLSRTGTAPKWSADGDVDFYKSQLAEIARDRDRGAIGAGEADGARIEAARRLLRAEAETAPGRFDVTSEPALRRRRGAAALALSVVPIAGLALYGALGSPRLVVGGLQSAARADGPPSLATALARMEDHLSAAPNDVRGWELVAPVYLRTGQFEKAATAFGTARRLGGDSVDRLIGEGEALVSAAGGMVSTDARDRFLRARELDATCPPARFYLAMAAEQDGDRDRAGAEYRSLLNDAASDAPWRPAVETRLAALTGGHPVVPRVVATPEIAAMVDGLDQRLRDRGGSEAEWGRLIRALVVLNRRDDALERLGAARAAFRPDPAAQDRLSGLARDLGLAPAVAGR